MHCFRKGGRIVKLKIRKRMADMLGNGIINAILLFLALSCLIPFLLILGSSFQSEQEIYDMGYRIIPKLPVFDAYRTVFDMPKTLIDAYKVTIITSVATTVAGVWVTASCGYVMSRHDYKYKKILSFYVFFTMLFNGGLVPTYILISNWLGLKDSLWALILPGICNAWYTLMIKGFFQSLPSSLIESAKLDGAGEFRIFVQIIIPISKPAIATIALFFLLGAWNAWQGSLLYIDTESKVKLQYLLMRILNNAEFLNSAEAIKYGVVREGVTIPTNSVRMAMCILAAGPILAVFPFFQKYFVKGITVGSVKG